MLVRNEWRGMLRDGRGVVLIALTLLLGIGAAWASASSHARAERAHARATEAARTAWNERKVDNPHARAHFGDFVFRPSGPASHLDAGVQAVTGRVVYTEAHRQNAAVHRAQRGASALLRFSRLEPSMVLQHLAPLVLVLLGFATVASERESGRLRLHWVQGTSMGSLLLAKSLALWSVGVGLALVVLGVHVSLAEAIDLGRTGAFFALHAGALWIVAVTVVGVSAGVRSSGAAAALLLALWVLSAIVLPRLAVMVASAAEPLPDRDAFAAAMAEDRKKGLDGHNPQDERAKALERKILAEYGVDTPEELPVILFGLLAQADEEYGARVWDEHFGALQAQLRTQADIVGTFSVVNPLQATDRLSMAIAGTGLESHVDFLRKTEAYRRTLIRTLNEGLAYDVKRADDGTLKPAATAEFYAGFEAFDYVPLSLEEQLRRRWLDLLALLGWMLGSTAALLMVARRLQRRGLT
ncbi:MAG: DUF3526 domain-containing protein [Myxococcota bacterium]